MQTVVTLSLSILLGPWNLVKFLATTFNISAAAFLHCAHMVSHAAAASWQAVRAGSSLAPTVAGSAKEVGSQASLLLERASEHMD